MTRIIGRAMLAIGALLLLFAAQGPLNIGHRGTGVSTPGNPFPENTIPSFEQAFLEGADMIELDVLLTADDVPVVIHDATLDRTTNCTGRVVDQTLAEIAECEATRGTTLVGVTVPTLAEVLATFDRPINVEIKSDDVGGAYDAGHLADRVTAVIDAAGARDRVVVSSFSPAVCAAVKAIDPSWVVALLTDDVNLFERIDAAYLAGLDGIHPSYLITLSAHVNYAHDLGLFVNVWTVNAPTLMQLNLAKGVDGIVTDEPDLLAELLGDDDDTVADDDDTASDDDDTLPDDDDTFADDDDTFADDDDWGDDDDDPPGGDDGDDDGGDDGNSCGS